MDDWFLPKIRVEIASLQQKRAQHMQNSGNIDLSPNYVLIDAALWDSDMEILSSRDIDEVRKVQRLVNCLNSNKYVSDF